MHLELTEILVCPDCGPGHGLIAFVDRMEDRRIVAGRLDCPMCERRHRIEDGTVRLTSGSSGSRSGSSGAPSAVRGEPPRDAQSGPELPDDAAAVAAALLGPPEDSEVLLLVAGTRILAPSLADLRPEAAIVTYGAARAAASADASHARVYPLVVAGDDAAPGFPFRSGVLDGAVLSGSPDPCFLEGVVRALSAGGRLVVLSPPPALTTALAELEGVEELAADPRAWVGSRR